MAEPAPDHLELLQWVEQVTAFLTRDGFPPIAGRILGWLLICDLPEQSAAELVSLAAEQEAAAALAKRQRKKAWGKFSDSDGTHDYRDRDMSNLRKRHRQYVGVAKSLRDHR